MTFVVIFNFKSRPFTASIVDCTLVRTGVGDGGNTLKYYRAKKAPPFRVSRGPRPLTDYMCFHFF